MFLFVIWNIEWRVLTNWFLHDDPNTCRNNPPLFHCMQTLSGGGGEGRSSRRRSRLSYPPALGASGWAYIAEHIITNSIEHQLSHNPSISLWNAIIPDPSRCSPTPGVAGPCRMYIPMWTYDNGECRRFVYGGCQGNKNRFGTKFWCRIKCKYGWPWG